MDDFQSIADGKAVFDFHRCPAFGVDFGNVADVLALFGSGMAAEVVLIVLGLIWTRLPMNVPAVRSTRALLTPDPPMSIPHATDPAGAAEVMRSSWYYASSRTPPSLVQGAVDRKSVV